MTPPTSLSAHASATTTLASRRTGVALQRTRMAAERTLMANLRTSLSLISFGFSIFQFFRMLHESKLSEHAISLRPAQNFSIALTSLGVLLLAFGIAFHAQFMLQLRRERHAMVAKGLLRGKLEFPVSLTLITAIALLLFGVMATVDMVFHVGPFH